MEHRALRQTRKMQAADCKVAKRYATAAAAAASAARSAAALAAEHAVADLSPIDQAYIAICLVAEAQG